MNRKYMPLILMLAAGAVTCVITFIKDYSIMGKLGALLFVFLLFYFLGNILKWTLDYFDRQNEAAKQEEGEMIEKETKGAEGEEKTEQEK